MWSPFKCSFTRDRVEYNDSSPQQIITMCFTFRFISLPIYYVSVPLCILEVFLAHTEVERVGSIPGRNRPRKLRGHVVQAMKCDQSIIREGGGRSYFAVGDILISIISKKSSVLFVCLGSLIEQHLWQHSHKWRVDEVECRRPSS